MTRAKNRWTEADTILKGKRCKIIFFKSLHCIRYMEMCCLTMTKPAMCRK